MRSEIALIHAAFSVDGDSRQSLNCGEMPGSDSAADCRCVNAAVCVSKIGSMGRSFGISGSAGAGCKSLAAPPDDIHPCMLTSDIASTAGNISNFPHLSRNIRNPGSVLECHESRARATSQLSTNGLNAFGVTGNFRGIRSTCDASGELQCDGVDVFHGFGKVEVVVVVTEQAIRNGFERNEIGMISHADLSNGASFHFDEERVECIGDGFCAFTAHGEPVAGCAGAA